MRAAPLFPRTTASPPMCLPPPLPLTFSVRLSRPDSAARKSPGSRTTAAASESCTGTTCSLPGGSWSRAPRTEPLPVGRLTPRLSPLPRRRPHRPGRGTRPRPGLSLQFHSLSFTAKLRQGNPCRSSFFACFGSLPLYSGLSRSGAAAPLSPQATEETGYSTWLTAASRISS